MRRRQLAVPFVVAALAVGAGGCGSDSPKPSPVTESSSAGSPNTMAAEAFTRQFIRTLNAASTGLDTTAWRKMFSNQCTYCERVADQIDSIRDNGGFFKAADWTINSIRVDQPEDGFITANARVHIPPQRVQYKKGGPVQRTAGQPATVQRLVLQQSQQGLTATDFGPARS